MVFASGLPVGCMCLPVFGFFAHKPGPSLTQLPTLPLSHALIMTAGHLEIKVAFKGVKGVPHHMKDFHKLKLLREPVRKNKTEEQKNQRTKRKNKNKKNKKNKRIKEEQKNKRIRKQKERTRTKESTKKNKKKKIRQMLQDKTGEMIKLSGPFKEWIVSFDKDDF